MWNSLRNKISSQITGVQLQGGPQQPIGMASEPSNLRHSMSETVRSKNGTANYNTSNSPPAPVRKRSTSLTSRSQTPLVSGSDAAFLLEEMQEENYEDWNRILSAYSQPDANKEELKADICNLVLKSGVPDHLRGKVWNILSKAEEAPELLELYPFLLKKESPSEVMDMISIDIMRTFPAHALFKDASGIGQDILLKISKAYSNYDEDVGYFQGLSFLAAALVLHLPEEEAFCLLVKMTYEYGLRGLYKNGMEALKIKFFQLERYIEDQMPELHGHLSAQEIETQMYASQWFLTVFCAKFSLSFAFRILDLFFMEGMEAVLKTSVCLLRDNRKELLSLSFEEILQYLRIQLPKKYSDPKSISRILKEIVEFKLNHAKLVQFENEYNSRATEESAEANNNGANSVSVNADRQKKKLERENKRLAEQNMRLEEETNSLARQLVERQVSLMQMVEKSNEEKSSLQKEITALKASLQREKAQAKQELDQLRTLYRTTVSEALEERSRLDQEKCELKALCRQLGQQHEQEKKKLQAEIGEMRSIVSFLMTNSTALSAVTTKDNLEEFIIVDPIAPSMPALSQDAILSLVGKIKDIVEKEKSGTESKKLVNMESEDKLKQLEEQLAITKLQLVESECQCQQLQLSLKQLKGESQNNTVVASSSWFRNGLRS